MEPIFVIIVVVVIFLVLNKFKKLRHEEVVSLFQKIIEKSYSLSHSHADALRRNRDIKSYVDDYGVWHTERWEKEFNGFYQNIIRTDLEIDRNIARINTLWEADKKFIDEDILRDLIYKEVNEYLYKLPPPLPIKAEEITHGSDYEKYCENIIAGCGWLVKTTPSTGDQGVDIIAEKNGIIAVLQCKYYSMPVGNAAVQEVVAGKAFYNGNIAFVVAKNGFTTSARELAAANGVHLLHHSELQEVFENIK